MSIPSTEFKPDRFRTQPQGQIRSYLGQATEQETQGFLEVLRQRAAIKPLTFILQLAVSVLFFVLGLAYDLPVVAVLGVLVLPAFSAIVSLALSSGLGSLKTFGAAFVVTILIVLALFGGGFLATQLQPSPSETALNLFSFVLNNSWLEWTALLLSALLTAVWFTTNNAFARVGALVFNFLAFVPFLLAGWQFGYGGFATVLPILSLGVLRLLAIVVLMIVVFWVLRIQPKGGIGWLILLLLAVLLGLALWHNFSGQGPAPEKTTDLIFEEIQITPPATEVPNVEPSPTLNPTPTQIPHRPSPTAMPSNTPEPTPTPQPREARVTAENGLRCRDLPNGTQVVWLLNQNAIVELLNLEEVVNGRTWQKVLTASETECWVDGAFLEIQTP